MLLEMMVGVEEKVKNKSSGLDFKSGPQGTLLSCQPGLMAHSNILPPILTLV